jgi:hypothetical protein
MKNRIIQADAYAREACEGRANQKKIPTGVEDNTVGERSEYPKKLRQ